MEENKWSVTEPGFDFTGKTVVVTGGTKGIGLGISQLYAKCGANVVVASRKQPDCDKIAAEINALGGKAVGIATDVRNMAQITALIDGAVAAFGSVDILVNCAGVAVTKKMIDLEEKDYDMVFETNIKSVIFASQAAAKQMISQGHGGKIINIASVGGLKGSNGLSLYGASKAAVINLTKTMAIELSRYGIQTNAVCPGYVVTEINRSTFENEAFLQKTLKTIPQRRLGTVEEIAALTLFLGCEQSYMINGEAIVADMGAICG